MRQLYIDINGLKVYVVAGVKFLACFSDEELIGGVATIQLYRRRWKN